jgi:CBS domain-containing protein
MFPEETTMDLHGQLPLKASDVMTPAPRSCSEQSTVTEAVLIMKDADCGIVPVTVEDKPVGVVTDRDIALALAELPDLASLPVSEIMSTDLVSVTEDATLADVRALMSSQAIRRILVNDEQGSLKGVISWSDIASVLSDRLIGRVVSNVVLEPTESR